MIQFGEGQHKGIMGQFFGDGTIAHDVIAYPQHFVGIRIVELGDGLLVTSQSCPDDTLHVHPIKLSFIGMMPYLTKRLHGAEKFFVKNQLAVNRWMSANG